MVLLTDHLWVVEVSQNDVDSDSVVSVSDSTTVVGFSDHVDQSLEWNLVVEVQELNQLKGGDPEVRGREGVGNVPAEWAELSSLQNDGVEEAQSPEEPSERDRLGARLELRVTDGLVGLQHVLAEALRRLTGGLDGVLDDGHWELVARLSGQPQSEGAVCWEVDLFDHAVKSWHERDGEMAILQHDPSSDGLELGWLGLCLGDTVDGLLALTLSEGKRLESDLLLLGEVEDLSHWIGTWRDDDDDRGGGLGVIEEVLHAETGWKEVGWSKFLLFLDDLLHGLDDLVWTQGSQDVHLLEESEVAPWGWPGVLLGALGIGRSVDLLPSLGVFGECIVEALEDGER